VVIERNPESEKQAMWDLNTIVRMNEEAQRRADAIREHAGRESKMGDQEAVVTLVACPLSQVADHHDAA
jgi:hypothetical protein